MALHKSDDCRMETDDSPHGAISIYQSPWTCIDLLNLTHWGRDEIAPLSRTTFSNAFSKMKIYEFRIKNIPSLVQIMAWCSPGDKPLSEPMMVRLLTHIWISLKISMFFPKFRINSIPSLVQIMAWCRPNDNLLYEPTMVRLPKHIFVSRPKWVKGMSMPCRFDGICLDRYYGGYSS